MKTATSKAGRPKHAIGTRFQKKFLGYGIWEGRITSFDGEDYEVQYLEDNYIEFISERDMDDIITRSNKYVQMKVKVETLQNQQVQRNNSPCSAKRIRMPTDRYAPPPDQSNIKQEQQSDVMAMKREEPSSPASITPSFTVGQHVWVSMGREMHSAKIKCILDSNKAKVQWTTMLTYSTVSMQDMKPMFDSNANGEVICSKFSKRKRGHTQRFVPPLPEKQEQMATPQKKKVMKREMASHRSLSKKKQYSPTQRGNKKAATKRTKSLVRPKKKYTFMKRELRDDPLPKQKSKEELRLEKEKEEEYKLLRDLYLEPKVRKNEELPGGIILRQKKATCGLLRCKTSLFRKQLHKTIVRLEKEGKKDEIHRMLKQMREHDETGAAGDGPKKLIEEILDWSADDDDEVAFVGNISSPACVKRECETFDLDKPRPKESVNVNTTFEPIAAMEQSRDDLPGNGHGMKVKVEKTTEAKMKESGMNSDAANSKRPVCSPSVVDCLMELEPKRYKRSEESFDLSTVSSLTFGGESSASITPIPTEITIRRRPRSIRSTFAGVQISYDTSETPSTNDHGQTTSQAESSEKKKAAAGGKPVCIDLSESNSDQTLPCRGEQEHESDKVIQVDVKAEQVTRRKSSSINDVIVIE